MADVDETLKRHRGVERYGQPDLRRAEQQMSAILAIAADAIISLDADLRITLFNEGAAAIFGYTQQEILGQPLEVLIPPRFRLVHAKHVSDFAVSPSPARKMGERQQIFALRKDGSEFPAEASIAKRDVDGSRIYIVVLREVTDMRHIETKPARANSDLEAGAAERTRALRAGVRRREETLPALIEAQRMEAFGQLTGGIAHDFNNLLTIINGNLELLADEVETDRARTLLKRAAGAAHMGATLTSRLLTFARRRRRSPRVIDLNELILGLTELLDRCLGEPITFTTVLERGLWATRADPSEIENALLNLALNARDAMPRGGSLVVETRNIGRDDPAIRALSGPEARDFVLVSVSDTGTGMTPEVLARAFEPFFTTKEPGRGTGLGLSTLSGFAQRSGGRVTISSEVGRGTTVSLYLPRAKATDEARDEARASETTKKIPLSAHSETILVVEDKPEVRELTVQRIEGLGYVAIDAEDGPAAIRILERGTPAALVFSDVVMSGGVSGYDLARWIMAHRPDIRILLTSGYAEEDLKAVRGGAADIPVLRKPYDRAALAHALSDALLEASGAKGASRTPRTHTQPRALS